MKKKVAIFAVGWGPELLVKFITGLQEGFKDDQVDLYMFMNYALVTSKDYFIAGELNIYNLPDLHDFDAAVVIANGMDYPGLFERITLRCKEAGIPTVCTGRNPVNGAHYVGADNEQGARELYSHIIDFHNCTDVAYIAGNEDNEDSNQRLRIIKECLEAKGASLPEENIWYSNWVPAKAIRIVKRWHQSGKKMPRAILCANDTLALPVSNMLIECGYRVPEDVIVTGFDFVYESKIHDPTITSIDQCFDQVGNESASIIKDLWQGKDRDEITLVSCKFIPGQSCGCTNTYDIHEARNEACKLFFDNSDKQYVFTSYLVQLENILMDGASMEDIAESYVKCIDTDENSYEGGTFHILLEPTYGQSIVDQETVFNVDDYCDILNVIVSLDGGHISSNELMDRRKLIPYISEENKENRFFYFLPIHSRENNLGYMVMADDISKIADHNYLYTYSLRISAMLEMYRQRLSLQHMNQKLIEYSAKDALTHVRNRGAYEKMEEELAYEMVDNSNFKFGLVMFDINNLKMVNDVYGHEAGDKYIVGSCRMICKIFQHSPVYRIGGDEFIGVLRDSDYEKRDELLAELNKKMEQLFESDAPFYEKFSVAAGVATYDSSIDECVDDVFNRADEAMYHNKMIMKQNMY